MLHSSENTLSSRDTKRDRRDVVLQSSKGMSLQVVTSTQRAVVESLLGDPTPDDDEANGQTPSIHLAHRRQRAA
jgi:hypothetical protein